MMQNGLFDIGILSFVFTPLALTIALLLGVWWTQIRECRTALPAMDTPGLLLASAVRRLPEDRREWAEAMTAELGQVNHRASRGWVAVGCAWVALFPPRRSALAERTLTTQSPVCGILSVALPPLGLPFAYLTAVIVEAIGGSPFTLSSRWGNPDAVVEVVKIIVKLSFFCLLTGLPMGIAGLFRRERLRWLSVLGMISSLSIVSYFIIVMHFTAGVPNGD